MEKTNSVRLFETGVYRPPSEGGSNSLLLRFTRNCPWNKCAFCAMYKTEKFERRSVEEIKADIDAMASIRDELEEIDSSPASEGPSRKAVQEFLRRHPGLDNHPGVAMFLSWMLSGGETAFLQDANTLIMKTPNLVEALRHLRSRFPSIKRVTTYARSSTLARKSPEELRDIREAGLDRLHIGLETGDDELLKRIRKGADSQKQITGGRQAVEAGFQVSEYWMPGLGGEEHWETHARETARVLSEINPHYIRSRPFHPLPGTPMYEEYREGSFRMASAHEQLRELQLTLQVLEVSSRVCFDHAGNYWRGPGGGLLFSHDYEGYKFPEQKQHLLQMIEEGLGQKQRMPVFLGL